MKSIFIHVIFAFLLIIFLIGLVQSTITYNKCHNDCRNTEECLYTERIHSGDWGLNDYCILYFEDSIKFYQLGG